MRAHDFPCKSDALAFVIVYSIHGAGGGVVVVPIHAQERQYAPRRFRPRAAAACALLLGTWAVGGCEPASSDKLIGSKPKAATSIHEHDKKAPKDARSVIPANAGIQENPSKGTLPEPSTHREGTDPSTKAPQREGTGSPSASTVHVALDSPAREACTVCHLVAGSAALKIVDVDRHCMSCHPVDRHPDKSHKTDTPLPPGMTTWLPLAADGHITCATCHDPHGTENKLIRTSGRVGEMCRACHVGY